jgi:uncharacterized protein YfeS
MAKTKEQTFIVRQYAVKTMRDLKIMAATEAEAVAKANALGLNAEGEWQTRESNKPTIAVATGKVVAEEK